MTMKSEDQAAGELSYFQLFMGEVDQVMVA